METRTGDTGAHAEEKGTQEETRTVGGVHVGGWVVICVLRCCVFSREKEGSERKRKESKGRRGIKRKKRRFLFLKTLFLFF